jgi:hypothetical protein
MEESHIQYPEAYAAARRRNIIHNARKTWLAGTPRAHEILDAVDEARNYNGRGATTYKEGFAGAMAFALDTYGKLTPKQSEAVLKGIDARAARKAEWASKQAALDADRAHVGAVGVKVTLNLTCVHVISFESSFGTVLINICEDDDKNVIIYKGCAQGFPSKGETATVTATVKEHGVRNGVKQTVIQRPKVAKQAEEVAA